MKNRKGFTIVELVIVIAVIAILAAVLIPTFSSVTASARASAAQQQAKAGLDSILALTEGSLPDGTTFCITNSTDQSLNYIFAYTGNKLESQDVTNAEIEKYSDGSYTIYVTAAAFGTDSEATKKMTAVTNLLLNILKSKLSSEFGSATAVSIPTTGTDKYYTAVVTGAADNATPIHVYYTSDIQETQIVFIGNENASSAPATTTAETTEP